MNSIINFFKRWIWSILGLLAFSLVIWFIGPLIAFAGHEPLKSSTLRWLVILVMVSLWGLNILRIQIQSSRANAQLAGDLSQNQEDADVDAEIGKIAKNFDEALQALKKDSNKAYSKNYLYELPWYIIIGPPGSGKTTALVNSGLTFPLEGTFGKGAVRGKNGTRNCDWWFTDQAVLIDTAGRYVTQDSHQAKDKKAWIGFLDLLKKHRPRRPVNGVLITMSLSDLLVQSEQERKLHAQTIRQRIEELSVHLGVRLPLYMLFTKADLIAGFNEFFATLSKEEREQVWGVTFPEENAENSDVLVRVGNDFEDLLTRLNSQLPKRLQDERNLQRRHLIFGFPQQMGLLKEILVPFLHECYGMNRFQSAPYLRGVYLTCGTQEGTPIDRLMGILADTFNVGRSSLSFSGAGRSYFISKLLKEVVFEEALLVGFNKRIERAQVLLRQGVYVSAIVILVVMTGLWITSYRKNQEALTTVANQLTDYQQIAKKTSNQANSDWQTNFLQVLPRLDALQKVTKVYQENVPILMTFGLYQGDYLQDEIKQIYNDLLKNQFLILIKVRLEQRITQQINNPATGKLSKLLAAYLKLAEPGIKPVSVSEVISSDWKTLYENDDTQTKLDVHLAHLLQLPVSFQPDEQLIKNAKQVLGDSPADKIYQDIQSHSPADKNLNLALTLGSNASKVFVMKQGRFESQNIPYLFTRSGFYDFLKQVRQQIVDKENELKELKSKQLDKEQLKNEIYALYYKDFIKSWDEILNNVEILPVANLEQMIERLTSVAGDDPLFRKLLIIIKTETALHQSPVDLQGQNKTAQILPAIVNNNINLLKDEASAQALRQETDLAKKIENHFQEFTSLVNPTAAGVIPIYTLNTHLSKLSACMIKLKTLSSTGGNANEQLANAECFDAIEHLNTQSGRLPSAIGNMIKILAGKSKNLISGVNADQVNDAWKTEVLSAYNVMKKRYPFNKNSAEEVDLETFRKFFAPAPVGVLEQFFNTHLKNSAANDKPKAIAQIQNTLAFGKKFFTSGGQLEVNFALKPIPASLSPEVSKFWLNIGGQTISYLPADLPQAVAAKWPSAINTVSFGFDTATNKVASPEITGAWALFKVLIQARIEPISKEKYHLNFEINGLHAEYELIANSADNPFSFKEFGQVNLPSSL